jgi:hypothetical protein
MARSGTTKHEENDATALERAYKARGGTLGKPENMTDEARARGASKNRDKAVTDYALVTPMIRAMRTEGLSLGAIAARLNEQGQTTRTKSAWNAVQVKRVLDRRAP